MRVLFWGTPDFATPPLRALLGEGFEIAGVVTQPDKPRGRSRSTLVPSPVKRIALEEQIPVLQPERPRGDDWLEQMRALAPDISVVVAYGHILPRAVIDLPPLGTLNIHASLLPKLRGAAPIQAAIREGHAETGVTIMQMVPALDAGPVLHTLRTEIGRDETYGELQLRLAELGASALIEALTLLGIGGSKAEPQNDAEATYAPKVEREMARVDWRAPATEVSRIVRAYDPKPGAFTTLGGTELKLFGVQVVQHGPSGAPGEVLDAGLAGMVVGCGGDTALRVIDVQPEGKRRMSVEDWTRGRGLKVGDVLGT